MWNQPEGSSDSYPSSVDHVTILSDLEPNDAKWFKQFHPPNEWHTIACCDMLWCCIHWPQMRNILPGQSSRRIQWFANWRSSASGTHLQSWVYLPCFVAKSEEVQVAEQFSSMLAHQQARSAQHRPNDLPTFFTSTSCLRYLQNIEGFAWW